MLSLTVQRPDFGGTGRGGVARERTGASSASTLGGGSWLEQAVPGGGDRVGMGFEALVGGERAGVAGELGIGGRGHVHDRRPLHEIEDRERRAGARPAARREHVIGADDEIAERYRRVLAEENLAGMMQAAQIAERLLRQDLQ